jgi:hypothetical protein
MIGCDVLLLISSVLLFMTASFLEMVMHRLWKAEAERDELKHRLEVAR